MAKRADKKPKAIPGVTDPDLKWTPPAKKSDRLLPLPKMHETEFEEICVDIAENEDGILRADLKRVKGVAQYGVDVEGFSVDHDPVLVVSCKRYQKITPEKITDWSDEFLDCWVSHWKDRGVQKFVLAVTVELNDDDIAGRIKTESLRFRELNLRYEVWGLKQLTGKLRPLRAAVGQYFHSGWVPIICGDAPSQTPFFGETPSRLLAASVTSEVGSGLGALSPQIAARFGDQVARRLASALERLYEGVVKPLRDLVAEIRNDAPSWDMLPSDIKARILNSEAILAMRDGDGEAAQSLIEQSGLYQAPKDRRLSGLSSYFRDGASAGLKMVENPRTSAEASLRAGLLLESGLTTEALEAIDAWPNTSAEEDAFEPQRLRALALAMTRDDVGAIEAITGAEAASPRNFSVRMTSAMIRFNAALSPRIDFQGGSFPNPLAPALFLEDDASLDQLDAAERIFADLAADGDDIGRRDDLQVWRLACLICSRRRSIDASNLAETLLSGERPHPGAITWAAHAGLKVDRERLIKTTSLRVEQKLADASEVVAAGYLLIQKGSRSRAANLFEKAREYTTAAEELQLIDQWLASLGSGLSEMDGHENPAFQQALSDLEASKSSDDVLKLIDAGGLDAFETLSAYEALMAFEKWPEVNERRSSVLTFGIARSVEIAAVAAFNSGDYQDCVSILAERVGAFWNGVLPYRLRQLEAQASLGAGRPDMALRVLNELAAVDPERGSALYDLAAARLQIGDLEGAADLMRNGALPKGLPIDKALRMALVIGLKDPEAARNLVRDVDWEKVNQAELPAALEIATKLRLQQALASLGPKAKQTDPTAVGAMHVIESVEEFKSWWADRNAEREQTFEELRQLWLRGEIPSHMLFDQRLDDLWTYFRAPFFEPQSLDADGLPGRFPLLLKSRMKVPGVEPVPPKPGRYGKLFVDLTAVLLGNQLGLLQHLASVADAVIIPQEVVQSLTTLEAEFGAKAGPVRATVERVRALVDSLTIREATDSDDDVVALRWDPTSASASDGGIDAIDLFRLLRDERGIDPEILQRLPERRDHVGKSLSTLPRKLKLDIWTAVQLSDAEALTSLVEHVELVIPPADVAQFKSDLDAHSRHSKLLSEVTALRLFVVEQLRKGQWRFPPLRASTEEEEQGKLESGPPMRSLLRALKACEQDATAIWVEDRVVSRFTRAGSAEIIGVEDLISSMTSRNVLTAEQARQARSKLASAGYSVMLPRVDEIRDALSKATISNGALVETPKLSEIRKATALQIGLARHLGREARPPALPEIAAASELIYLFSKIVAPIWNDAKLSDANRRAQSEWVWRNLRTEQVDYLPLENRSEEARRQISFLSYYSLVTTAFQLQRKKWKASNDARTKYLKWAFDEIVDPFVRMEPTLAEWLASHLADMLASLIDRDKSRGEISDKRLSALLQEYMQCFPREWRHRIQDHKDLKRLLAIVEVESVTVGDGLEFLSKDFFGAVAQSFSARESSAPLRNRSGLATFKLLETQDGETAPRPVFEVTSGSRVARVADDFLELLSEDPSRRIDVLLRNPLWFDLSSADLLETAERIGSEPDFAKRRAKVDEHRSRSVPYRLEKLRQQIESDGRSDIDLLAPPHPDAIRHYLRWPHVGDGDELAAACNTAFASIARDLGKPEAILRTAGIPIDVDDVAIEASELDAMPLNPALGATPQRFARILRLARGAGLSRERLDFAELDRRYSQFGRFFLALLSLVFRAAACSDDWAKIAEPHRSALLWAHADSITSVFMSCRVRPDSAAKLMAAYFKGDFNTIFDEARTRHSPMRSPSNLSVDFLLAAATASVIGDDAEKAISSLSEKETRDLKALVGKDYSERWYPNPEVLLPSRAATDAGSWFDRDIGAVFLTAQIFSLPSPFDTRDLEAICRKIIDEMGTRAADGPDGMWSLLLLVDPASVDDATRQEILAALRIGIGRELIEGDPLIFAVVMMHCAKLFAADAAVEQFLAFLSEVTKSCVEVTGKAIKLRNILTKDTPENHRFGALLEACFAFACHSQTVLVSCMTVFTQSIVKIADIWPGALLSCLAMLETLAGKVPVSAAGEIWQAILVLRSR